MEWDTLVDVLGAFLMIFGSLGFIMLLCLGVVSIVPGKKEEEE